MVNCLKCLVLTEKAIDHQQYNPAPYPEKYWYDTVAAEADKVTKIVSQLKPKSILEIGCGSGIVIAKLLSTDQKFKKIVGIEAVEKISNYAKKRFKRHPNIEIINHHVVDTLTFKPDTFDLCINIMNIVGWQKDETKWLKEMLRCSKTVFFTAYKKGKELDRENMYKTRGHSTLYYDSDQIVFPDCSIGCNIMTKSYTKQEIEKLCSPLGKYEIFNVSDLLYGCLLEKNYQTKDKEKSQLSQLTFNNPSS